MFIALAVPLTFLLIILNAAFLKDIKKDYGNNRPYKSPKSVVYEDGCLIENPADKEADWCRGKKLPAKINNGIADNQGSFVFLIISSLKTGQA